ncbi:hypothetical protein HWV62_11313, partial [Athelia sp. TMB]
DITLTPLGEDMQPETSNEGDLALDQGPVSRYPRPSANALSSLAIPTDFEKQKSQDAIKSIEVYLGELSERVAPFSYLRPNAELTHCYKERKSALRLLEEHRAVLAPIRVLSDDALNDIFTAYVDAQPHPLPRGYRPAPLVLSWVCRRWRAISATTPLLWSRVSLRFVDNLRTPRAAVTSSVACANMLGHYQSRSAACPLHVAIKTPDLFDLESIYDQQDAIGKFELDMLRLYIGTLAGAAERLKTLDIACPTSVLEKIYELLSARSPDFFPSLERITIESDAWWRMIGGSRGPLQLFSVAPKLRHADVGRGADGFVLPWAQLESWRGSFPSIAQFVDLLHRAPNLVRGTLLADRASSEPQARAPVRHGLRALEFTSCSDGQFEKLLDSLALPALVDLRLYLSHAELGPTWPPRAFARFMQRSACTLHTLALDADFFHSTAALVEVLGGVPSVVALECSERGSPLYACVISSALLERLTLGPATAPGLPSTALLPNLKSLRFMGSFWEEVPDTLVPMLESRASGAAPLQSFYLRLDPWPASYKGGRPALGGESADVVKTALVHTALEIEIVDTRPKAPTFLENLFRSKTSRMPHRPV